MNDGDERNVITYDEATGAVTFTRPTDKGKQIRIVPLQACAWVELFDTEYQEQLLADMKKASPELMKPPTK